MLKIPIRQMREAGDATLTFAQETEKIFEDIHKRAFELFQERGCRAGYDLADWLQAERELLSVPAAELIETDTQFKLRLAMPAYEAKDIRVTVFPDTIIVSGETHQENRKKAGTVHLNELASRKLFRRLNLSSSIHVDQVTATLEEGLLRIVATKTEAATGKIQTASLAAAG